MTLQQILQQKGIECRSSRLAGEIKLRCPFCGDPRFLLSINITKNLGHCFHCNWKSRSAARQLIKVFRLPVTTLDSDNSKTIQVLESIELPEGYHTLTQPQDELDHTALAYLLGRGLSIRQITNKKIGASFLGRYAFRAIFPVLEGKQLHGFVSRALNANMKPRYLNSVGDKALYNFRPAQCFVLLEGVFKCLRLERVLQHIGANANACAVLGHSLTEIQLNQILKAKPEHVVIWPDLDQVGCKGALKMAQQLREHSIQVEFVVPTGPADEVSFGQLLTTWCKPVPFSWAVSSRLLTPGAFGNK